MARTRGDRAAAHPGIVTVANYAGEIRLRAERRLGELLAETPKNKGGEPMKARNSTGPQKVPVETLADSGISKKLSSRAQSLAARAASAGDSTRTLDG